MNVGKLGNLNNICKIVQANHLFTMFFFYAEQVHHIRQSSSGLSSQNLSGIPWR